MGYCINPILFQSDRQSEPKFLFDLFLRCFRVDLVFLGIIFFFGEQDGSGEITKSEFIEFMDKLSSEIAV